MAFHRPIARITAAVVLVLALVATPACVNAGLHPVLPLAVRLDHTGKSTVLGEDEDGVAVVDIGTIEYRGPSN